MKRFPYLILATIFLFSFNHIVSIKAADAAPSLKDDPKYCLAQAEQTKAGLKTYPTKYEAYEEAILLCKRYHDRDDAIHIAVMEHYFKIEEYNKSIVYAKLFHGADAYDKRKAEVLVRANMALKRYGQSAAYLNKYLSNGDIKEDPFAWHALVYNYEGMGSHPDGMLTIVERGLKKFPEDLELLQKAVFYHELRGNEADLKKLSAKLEKKLYTYGEKVEDFPLHLIFGDKAEEGLKNHKLEASDFAYGAARHQVYFTHKDHKKSKSLKDYPDYEKKVYNGLDGIVLETSFSRDDHGPGQSYVRHFDNYVIVMHNIRLYSYFYNIKRKSSPLDEGDFIAAGELVGKIGNVGRHKEPRLAFELRDKGQFNGKSLPLK